MKRILISLLLGVTTLAAVAQEKIYQIEEVSVLNYGDGRLLFRQINEEKTPLNGEHRIIDGYRSEYLLAQFKDGMYHGSYQYFKSNKLKESGTYKEGRKDGLYKEYYSDGVKVQKETPYTTGKLNGTVKKYYTDGNLESEKGYAMSVEDGVERRYDYQSGELTTDRNYKAGVLHGKQMNSMGSNTGDYVEHATYENGKPVGEFSQTFTDGTIKKLGHYNANGKRDGEWLERDNFSKKNNDKFAGKRTVYKDGEVVSEDEIGDFEKFQRKRK